MQLVIGGLLVLISLWFNLSYSSPGFYLPHNDAQIKGSAASSSNGDGESFTRPDADMPTYGIWQETGPNFSTPLHEWSEQCQLPPPNQIWRSRSMQADHGHGQRKKIAFLLMEYDGVTFPDVWGEYFGRANPSHYALYIHIQKKKIPRTMSYHDLQSAHPGLYTLDESMQKVADNVQILKTTEDSYWLHLMPIFLNFWREAIVDQDVAG